MMFLIILVFAIALGFAFLNKTKKDPFLDLLPSSRKNPDPLQPRPKRYTVAKSLITEGEQTFYSVLRRALPEAAIHPKVRVSDVIKHTTGNLSDFRRISQFHFDWVICHPTSCEPLLAIELDDSSHRRANNKRNDDTKNQVAEEADFTVLRFPWARSYNEDAIRERIGTVINQIADKKDKALHQKMRQKTNANETT